MKIVLNKTLHIEGYKPTKKGEAVNVSEQRGKQLIQKGFASEYNEKEAKSKPKTKENKDKVKTK